MSLFGWWWCAVVVVVVEGDGGSGCVTIEREGLVVDGLFYLNEKSRKNDRASILMYYAGDVVAFFPAEEAGARSPVTSPVQHPFSFLLLEGPSVGCKDNNGPGAGFRGIQKKGQGRGRDREREEGKRATAKSDDDNDSKRKEGSDGRIWRQEHRSNTDFVKGTENNLTIAVVDTIKVTDQRGGKYHTLTG